MLLISPQFLSFSSSIKSINSHVIVVFRFFKGMFSVVFFIFNESSADEQSKAQIFELWKRKQWCLNSLSNDCEINFI